MIMAGGAGTRLWPMSRQGEPKQLIRFVHRGGSDGPVSLLEEAAGRLKGLIDPDRWYICTGEKHREQIRGMLPSFSDDRILGEPMGRDTLNAVGFGAAVFGKDDPDAVYSVLTADHLIDPQETFAQAMEVGYKLVEEDPTRLVSFGIRPTYPATGFGYIEDGGDIQGTEGLGFSIARFVEKPPLEKARQYLATGRFSWNAGMFVFHAKTFMDLLEKYRPESFKGLMKIREAWGTDDQEAVVNEVYPKLPKISVDYAIMEPAAADTSVSLCGVRMNVSWLDVGSWPSYGETLRPDADGNRGAGAKLVSHDSRDNIVVSNDGNHTVALLGCDDMIVVHTPTATLVMPRDRAQDLKALHGKLPEGLK